MLTMKSADEADFFICIIVSAWLEILREVLSSNCNLKQKLILFLLFLIPAISFSQGALMVFNEKQDKQYIYNTGRGIKFRTKHNHKIVQGRIISVKDSFMVINRHPKIDTIPLSDIFSVKKIRVSHIVTRVLSTYALIGPALAVYEIVTVKQTSSDLKIYAILLPPMILLFSIPWLVPRRELIISDDGWKMKVMDPEKGKPD